MFINFFKSIFHNIGVIVVGFIFASIGLGFDFLLRLHTFRSVFSLLCGLVLISIGFSIRVWATYYFYKNKMGVIKLTPQNTLITEGPFQYSRNPLYLGGNVFIFLGAVCIVGSPSGIILTVIEIFLTNFMIMREEKQLERKFGKKWQNYKKRVRRWM